MSFQIKISPQRAQAVYFLSAIRQAFKQAIVDGMKQGGPNQSEIARRLGVHKSVISRELNGAGDITAGRIAELAYALGLEAHIELRPFRSGEPARNLAAFEERETSSAKSKNPVPENAAAE